MTRHLKDVVLFALLRTEMNDDSDKDLEDIWICSKGEVVSPLAAQAVDLQWKVGKDGRIETKHVQVGNKKAEGAVSIFESNYEHKHVGFREEGPIDLPLQRG